MKIRFAHHLARNLQEQATGRAKLLIENLRPCVDDFELVILLQLPQIPFEAGGVFHEPLGTRLE